MQGYAWNPAYIPKYEIYHKEVRNYQLVVDQWNHMVKYMLVNLSLGKSFWLMVPGSWFNINDVILPV